MSRKRETYGSFFYLIVTGATPSNVIFTGLMKHYSSNSSLSIHTWRSLPPVLSNGRR